MELPRQKKAKRIHVHQTSTARYAKGTALRRGRKTVKEKGTTAQRECNGNEYVPINNNLKCKWIK